MKTTLSLQHSALVPSVPTRPNRLRVRRSLCLAGLVTTLVLSANWHVQAVAVSTLNAYLGIAKTFYGLGMGLRGRTTVQPAHALHLWQREESGTYGRHADDGSPCYFGTRMVFRRNPANGQLFYWTWQRDDRTGGWICVSHEPIWVGNEMGRLSELHYDCSPSPGYYHTTETYVLAAWAASIVKTGWYPPGPPYKCFFRTDTETLPEECDADFQPVFETKQSWRFDLPESGGVVLVEPFAIQRIAAFPMLQWVGQVHDYRSSATE